MIKSGMRQLFALLSLLVIAFSSFSQQEYFLFIQSDNSQPFYVQANSKTYSSSGIGHLIIPGLKDSTYTLAIGFPRNQFPEQIFEVKLNRKDAGFQLKSDGGGNWSLFNLQTLQFIKSKPVQQKQISYGDIRKSDHFSVMMAGLVNDSAVLYTSIAKVEPVITPESKTVADVPVNTTQATTVQQSPPKQEVKKVDTPLISSRSAKRPDSTLVAKQPEPKKDEPIKFDTSTAEPLPVKVDTPAKSTSPVLVTNNEKRDTVAEVVKSSVELVSEKKNQEGIKLLFAERSGQAVDTIDVFISSEPKKDTPAIKDTPSIKPEEKNTPVIAQPDYTKKDSIQKIDSANASRPIKENSSPKLDTVRVDTLVVRKDSSSVTRPEVKTSVEDSGKNKVVLINSDCTSFATDFDVDKLRIKMLGERDADGQVSQARKVFKTKCFSTKQIRALTELFPSDEGKYKLFDAAYPFVSDTANFRELASLLTDPYFINRFKAMVRM